MGAGKVAFVTGGLGYIGATTCVLLLRDGWSVSILDDCSNSDVSVVANILEAAGVTETATHPARLFFVKGDVRDAKVVKAAMTAYRQVPQLVIHFAALKSVADSFERTKEYMDVNVRGMLTVAHCAAELRVPEFVFSSSATVYGTRVLKAHEAFVETDVQLDSARNTFEALDAATSPYGQTKIWCEHLLHTDARLCAARDMHITILRYFNPVGAIHEALGERLISSTNLFVHAMRAVVCEGAPPLTVFGTDYDTADGSAVRDYVHVVDVARAHICAYQTYLHERDLVSYFHSMPRIVTLNIGSSVPTSVLQVLHTFETATGVAIPHELGPRRAGDVPVMRCDASLAHTHLSWRATLGLDEACRDALAAARRWVSAGDMSPA